MKDSLKKIELDAYYGCQAKILSILRGLKNGKDLKLLDIGCSDGSLSIKMAEACGANEVHGLEVEDDAIAKAKKLGIKVHKTDVNGNFPFVEDYFDVVVASQIVEHLSNPDNLFIEAARVLKPGGHCIIATPNLCSLHNRIFMFLGWQITTIAPSTKVIFGNPGRGAPSNMCGPFRHITAFSPKALREMCEYYGLMVESISGSGFHPLGGRLSRFFSSLFPSLSVFIIAKSAKKSLK